MVGRPKKKPEYNPELQFNNFLQELRDAYEKADSLRSLADELNICLLYTSPSPRDAHESRMPSSA